MIRFEHIDLLWGLLTLPVMFVIFILKLRWNKITNVRFGELKVVKRLMGERSNARSVFKSIIFIIAYIFLIIGLANPQLGSKMEQVKRKGIDIMIALDVSNSMMAEDMFPNRLERAKRAISKLIDHLKGDRIGIVVFGGQAYVQLPITMDYAAAKMFLASINCNMIPTQGTAIGSAIDKCMSAFDFDNKTSKSIIIITDGENHEDDAIDAAKKGAEKGLVIHTIGMGSTQGAPIPIKQNGQNRGFKKDKEGTTVVTKLDENMLQLIASAGNGIFVRATNANSGIELILEEVGKMQKTEFGSKIYTEYEDRFQYFVAVAIILLLIEILLPNRKIKWLHQLNLFNTNP